MSLIDKTYFKADIALPKSDFDNIASFITKFEKDVLISLLGYELYKKVIETPLVEPYKSLIEGTEYSVYYNGKNRLVKWNGLVNADKISLISYYTYCYYLRSIVSSTQQVGEVKHKQINSDNANVFGKIIAAWSNFESLYGSSYDKKIVPSAYNYLTEKSDLFPEWIFTELTGSMNSHDL